MKVTVHIVQNPNLECRNPNIILNAKFNQLVDTWPRDENICAIHATRLKVSSAHSRISGLPRQQQRPDPIGGRECDRPQTTNCARRKCSWLQKPPHSVL